MENKSLYAYCVRIPLCLVIIALIGMGIFSRRGWLDWRRMVRQNEELQAKIGLAQRSKELLDIQIRRLQTDPNEQDRVIRQVLGYVKPNETIIEFE